MGQAERDRQNGTGRTGKQNKTNKMRKTKKQKGIGRTRKTKRDRQNRKDRTGQTEKVFCTVLKTIFLTVFSCAKCLVTCTVLRLYCYGACAFNPILHTIWLDSQAVTLKNYTAKYYKVRKI